MNWQHWIERAGLHVPPTPDLESLIVAAVLVAGAGLIGWYVGCRWGPPVTRRLQHLGGRAGTLAERHVARVLRYCAIALLLLVVSNAVPLSPLGALLLAFSLGAAVALLAYNAVSLFGLGRMSAAGPALAALVMTTAATLGGMQPLTRSLDLVGVSVGGHRFSLLAAINAIIVVALLFGLAKVANHLLFHLIGRAGNLDISQRVLVQKLAGIGVIVVAVLFGIDLLGIDLTALTVFSGAAGLAVGFGLQKTFGNLIAGLILLMDRSVKPGDVIVVGDTFGAVGKIGVRAVSVVTRDGKEHLIPNEQLMTEPVENSSYSNRNVRVHIPVGVSYG